MASWLNCSPFGAAAPSANEAAQSSPPARPPPAGLVAGSWYHAGGCAALNTSHIAPDGHAAAALAPPAFRAVPTVRV